MPVGSYLLRWAAVGQQQHRAGLQLCVLEEVFVFRFVQLDQLFFIDAESLGKLSWRLIIKRFRVVMWAVFPLVVALQVGLHVLLSSALVLLHELAGSG